MRQNLIFLYSVSLAFFDVVNDHRLKNKSSKATTHFNLDPDPIVEEQSSEEQLYRQKVYLRQFQHRTPQPVEIQV